MKESATVVATTTFGVADDRSKPSCGDILSFPIVRVYRGSVVGQLGRRRIQKPAKKNSEANEEEFRRQRRRIQTPESRSQNAGARFARTIRVVNRSLARCCVSWLLSEPMPATAL